MDKNPKHRKFKDPNSRISSEDIESCTDIETLLNWKITINGNIADAELQLGKAKGIAASKGEYMDTEKYQSLLGYRKVLGFLSQKIQFRQRQLNHDNKTFSSIFLECAQRMLSPQEFDKIHQAATEIKLSL